MPDIQFSKYHALENDFIVIESRGRRLPKKSLQRLAQTICNRRSGIGADGVAYLSTSRKADKRIDIYNADGSWAEKSGNGLRIAAVHLSRKSRGKRRFVFETATSKDLVTLGRLTRQGRLATAELGRPDFRAASVPVKVKKPFVINMPLKTGPEALPVTCLSVGNPHTVLVVQSFDFDWQTIGADLEQAKHFPNGTNVEFVRVTSRKRLEVADWERGAGATGSSGTGAAAAVCAMVMLGLAERECEVVFRTGSLQVHWRADDDIIELTGPVQLVCRGIFPSR
ncbi:diaminopimelate epimerase [candidate division GN15 bacterium]|nr:diaminopimelate epimerase [candidate division GN15 bacterium]